jgi:ATP-dependent RNA helicase DeaD
MSEEDLTMARALLDQRSAEEIATALVRLHRSRLQAPEEVFDGGSTASDGRGSREKSETRGPRRQKADGETEAENMVWFRMSAGRRNSADPRWLVPIICRLGHVTNNEIGPIRIFDRDTKFGIAQHAASRFAASVRRSSNDEDIRIEPAQADASAPGRRDPKPYIQKPASLKRAKPSSSKSQRDRMPRVA